MKRRWYRQPIPADPCPICVHLNQWYGDTPIQAISHGAGSPRGHWRACFGHYKVISAFEWIGLTPGVCPEESETA